MSEYKGKTVTLDRPCEQAYERLADFSAYQTYIDRLPEEVRSKIGEVRFEPDAILITVQPVGEVALRVVERRAPSLVKLEAEKTPVPLAVELRLAPAPSNPEGATEFTPVIDVDVPMMLRPLVAPKMQEAADKMGEMLANLFNAGDAAPHA